MPTPRFGVRFNHALARWEYRALSPSGRWKAATVFTARWWFDRGALLFVKGVPHV